MSIKLTGKLREALAREVDVIGFLTKIAAGQPVALTGPDGQHKGTLVPSMRHVYEVNLWIAERLVPKVKDVTLTHDVAEGLADRVRAAREKALTSGEAVPTSLSGGKSPNIADTSLEGGGGPAKPAPSRALLVPPADKPMPEIPAPNFSAAKNAAAAVIDVEAQEIPPVKNPRLEKIPAGFGRVPPPDEQPRQVQTVVETEPSDEPLTSEDGIPTSSQLAAAGILEGL